MKLNIKQILLLFTISNIFIINTFGSKQLGLDTEKSDKIKLLTKDKKLVSIDPKIALQSELIKTALEGEIDKNIEIPINISQENLDFIVNMMKAKDYNQINSLVYSEDTNENINKLNIAIKNIHYLDMPDLLNTIIKIYAMFLHEYPEYKNRLKELPKVLEDLVINRERNLFAFNLDRGPIH